MANSLWQRFNELREKIESSKNDPDVFKPLTYSSVHFRASISLVSHLIFDENKIEEAKQLLTELKENAFTLHFSIICCLENEEEIPQDKLDNCTKLSQLAYEESQEPRSKLLRGMIYASCLAWKKDKDQLEIVKMRLLKNVKRAIREGGAATSVFSPVSQKNELPDTIYKQINDITVGA